MAIEPLFLHVLYSSSCPLGQFFCPKFSQKIPSILKLSIITVHNYYKFLKYVVAKPARFVRLFFSFFLRSLRDFFLQPKARANTTFWLDIQPHLSEVNSELQLLNSTRTIEKMYGQFGAFFSKNTFWRKNELPFVLVSFLVICLDIEKVSSFFYRTQFQFSKVKNAITQKCLPIFCTI